jgi:hypothetical protein
MRKGTKERQGRDRLEKKARDEGLMRDSVRSVDGVRKSLRTRWPKESVGK